jgi:2-oxoglutarate dehydrogenase E2 component (dihydrolipoamide succinyltransferase)
MDKPPEVVEAQQPQPPYPGPQPGGPPPQPPKPEPPEPEQPGPQPPPPPIPSGEEAGGPLSPLVRRMAREHNIDLRQVKGTGAGGRITKADIESYLSQRGAAPAAAAAPTPAPPVEAPPAAPEMPPVPRPEAARTRLEPMSTMRQRIAEHMVASKRTSAHVTTVHHIDMTRVAHQRERHKRDVKERYGFSLTFLPFIARAATVALRAYPLCNASIEGANIIHHNEVNLGIAVALDNGLIVPVIRNADEKNVIGLQRAIADLATRARSRQLKPDEVHGGTFSITNFGSFGSLFGTPIINQPQVAILGVGAVQKTPVVVETDDGDSIAIRSISLTGLTFDHRLIDGAYADQFMQKVKGVLENWSEEVL